MPSRDVNRIVLVPRWAGSGESDFYPWLREQVGVTVTAAPLLPSPGAPEVEPTTEAVLRALGDDPEALAATVLMGHSVGVQAAMRALALIPGRSAPSSFGSTVTSTAEAAVLGGDAHAQLTCSHLPGSSGWVVRAEHTFAPAT